MDSDTDPAAGDDDGPPTGWWARYRRFIKPLLIAVVGLAVGWIVINLVGSINWAEVGAALSRLAWWQVLPLAGLLLLRQLFNAVPLTRFVPGLSTTHSLQNDLSANLVATVAPPPGDVVLRVSMFSSWGISPVDGMAGVTLNMLTFYAVRFLAPVIGLVLLIPGEIDRGQLVLATISALVAVAVIVGLVLVLRGDRMAALLGRTAGRVVKRFRSSVDPEAWALSVVDFSARMSQTLKSGLLPSMLALEAMLFVDAAILLVALRFVGVDSSALSPLDVWAAFLIAYPLTLLPFFGLGVLDAALASAWVEIAGQEFEPEILAGLAVWRVTTLLGTLGLGVIALGLWRRKNPTEHLDVTA